MNYLLSAWNHKLALIGVLAASFLISPNPTLNAEEGVFFSVGSDRNISKIHSVRYLKKSDQALTISADKCVRLWDVNGWKKLDEFRFHIGHGRIGEVSALSVSDDESQFAIGRFGNPAVDTPGDIFLVQKSPRKILRRLLRHKHTVTQLAFFDNDQKLLSVDESGLLLLWDLSTGSVVGNVSFSSGNERITCLSFNDRDQLAVGTSTGRVHLLATSPLKLLKTQSGAHPGKRVKSIFWANPSELISIGDGGNLKLWKWDSRSLTNTSRKALGDQNNLQTLCLDRDGKRFFAFFGANENFAEAGKATISGRVFGFDLKEQPRLKPFDSKERMVQSAQYVPARNELIANLITSTIETWNLKTTKLVSSFENESKNLYNVRLDQSAQNSADGLRLLWREKRVFDVERNKVPLTHGYDLFENEPFQPLGSQTKQNEDYLVGQFSIAKIATDPRKLVMIQVQNGRPSPIAAPFLIQDNRHGTMVTEAALVSQNVAVVGTDEGLFLFHPRTGKEIKRLDHQSKGIHSISFTPDHRFFTTYSVADRTTAIWSIGQDPSQPELLASLAMVGSDWALVSPAGHFDCTPAAQKFFGWHVNAGETEFASFHDLERFRDKFHNPGLFEMLWFNGNLRRSLKTLRIVQRSIRGELGPRISLITPEKSSITQKTPDFIEVGVEFEANGNEVPKAIALLINDRPHEQYYHEVEKGQSRHNFQVKLAQGRQEISAKVYSDTRKSTVSSRQIEVDFRPYGSQQKPQGKLFFLGIGIDKYQHYDNLDYCGSDVKVIGEVFSSGSRGAFNQEPEVSTPTITTKQQFEQELQKLLADENGNNEFKQTDTLVVMWSGHGDVDNDNQFHLILPDCKVPTHIDDSSLHRQGLSALDAAQVLKNINGGHIILILDTCYAGKAVEQFRDSAGNLARETNSDEYGIMVISATGATETSKENRELGMSNFAFLLRTGLLGQKIYELGGRRVTAQRDPLVHLDGMDIVTTHSLVEFLKREMPGLNSSQTINTNGFGSRVKFLASR